MKYLFFIFVIPFANCLENVTSNFTSETSKSDNQLYCFKFTWPGGIYTDETDINCTEKTEQHIPCFDPIAISTTPPDPNSESFWDSDNESTKKDFHKYTCPLQPGESCLKYTYSFNDAIVNATYFCGKMIDGGISALTSGCYTQKTGGYTVEACSCISTGTKECPTYKKGCPCNAGVKMTYSAILGTIILFIFIMN